MQTTKIGELSDGQQSRLVFAMICMKNPNLLLLDEPTNHLDIEAIDSLAEAIKGFKGGLVLVSHDFRLIDQVSHHNTSFCVVCLWMFIVYERKPCCVDCSCLQLLFALLLIGVPASWPCLGSPFCESCRELLCWYYVCKQVTLVELWLMLIMHVVT